MGRTKGFGEGSGHKVPGRKPPLWERWPKLWEQVSKEKKEEDRGKRTGHGIARACEGG